MNLLAKLVCSRVRADIFQVLFGLRSGEVHLREIHRQTTLSLGTVRQDIRKLAKLGLVTERRDGNRLYYAANQAHPLYPDIRQLVLKTVGLVDIIRKALKDPGIRHAFVFGSVANGSAGATSDIDLLVVGNLGLRKLSALLSGLSHTLGREINPHILTPAEFARRVGQQDHFVTSVLAAPRLFVKGSQDELEAMVQ